MQPKIKTLVVYPGEDLEFRTLPFEEYGVLVDRKGSESVLLTAPPINYRRGTRVHLPFDRVEPIRICFAGDGEDLNVLEGPLNDWRETPEEVAELDDEEKIDLKYRHLADKRIEEIGLTSEKKALMHIRDERTHPQAGGMSALVTMTSVLIAVVMLLIVITYVNNTGGIGGALGFPSTDPQPTPAPTSEGPVF